VYDKASRRGPSHRKFGPTSAYRGRPSRVLCIRDALQRCPPATGVRQRAGRGPRNFYDVNAEIMLPIGSL